ncbi:reverse transcriptase domain-containing protein [Tanacetum coccineum]
MSGCSINQKVKYTAGSFVGKALMWLNSQIRTLSREVVVCMSWNDFKFMMIQEFCPSHEMQKLESELWNHAMVGAGHALDMEIRKRKEATLGLTTSRLRPYHFTYPKRELTMEEILHRFIDEGKLEHEEMGAFIKDFKTTNEILLKERDNSLIELRFEDDTNMNDEEPFEEARDKSVESNEVLMENQPQGTNAPIVQQSIREQTPSIPFPKRLRKENEEAQQRNFLEKLKQLHVNIPFIEALIQMPKYAKYLKSLLTNKCRLEAACMVTMNERCSSILLNELTSKEKDSTSIWRIDPVNTPYSEKKPELEKISEEEKSSLLQVLEKLKEAEDLAADHLSRFESLHMEVLTEREIADKFSDEHLMELKSKFKDDEPWYADFVNYIVGKVVPPNWTFEKRKRFFSQVKTYFWEEPYAFKLCTDNIIRRCVAGSETLEIMAHCHSGPTGGHHSANVTAKKVYEAGFYWPSVFKDANEYVRRCDACQRSENISSRNEMPQNNIQVCEVFDVWGLDFMGPFPNSRGNKYILVAVDYVSKSVEAQALPTNDARVVFNFLRSLFARFGVPKALISDRGTHFCNSQLEKALQRYGVTHKLSTAYHPQFNEQTEVTNRAIKRILERSVGCNPKDFKVGDKVLLYNSRLKMYPGKLKSKWSGPNIVKTVYPHGAIEITDRDVFSFKVNGKRLKKYYEGDIDKEDDEVIELENDATRS